MRGEGFCGGIIFEGDDVDGFAGRAGDGRYPRRVESFIASDPFSEHGVIDSECSFAWRFLYRTLRCSRLAITGLICWMVFL